MEKQKQKPQHQWTIEEKIAWLLFGVLVFVGVTILIPTQPQHFEITSDLLPTAEYLRDFPYEENFEIETRRLPIEGESSFEVCIYIGNHWWDKWEQALEGDSIIIDGTVVRNTATGYLATYPPADISRCAYDVRLAQGLHLVEYQNHDTIYNQIWSIEIE